MHKSIVASVDLKKGKIDPSDLAFKSQVEVLNPMNIKNY